MVDDLKKILETLEKEGQITLPSGDGYILIDGVLMPKPDEPTVPNP